MSPSQVEAVKQMMCYMEELQSKKVSSKKVSKEQPRTPDTQLVVGVGAALLGLKRENALRRLLLKQRDRKLKSHTLLGMR